ncbi:MAG: type IV pilus assembly protein PilM [Patescibacteria group bacterium]|nr:type IV pilus assembly protein PilM [Patescibacteria group bacterium]
MSFPFRLIPKNSLGIDIGTSSIKMVELSRWGERRKLENYGELSSQALYEKPFRTFEKSALLLSNQDIARAITAILEEAKIKTREVIFSIPDFSTFFTTFELPPMTEKELPQAVRYEARLHIPLPLSEVTIDWRLIEGRPSQKTPLKILLVSVPNEVINQYQEIARLANLQFQALEAEVFSLIRSLIGEDKRPICLIDIGAQSTTCSIVEKGILKISHSFDFSGNELTSQIAKSLNIDYKKAEEYKKKYGLFPSEQNIREILLPLIDFMLNEIDKISGNFYRTERKGIEKIILAGGTALLPGLKEYFFEKFQKEIEIANPFSNIFYPPILEEILREMGPAYAIAVGTALRGLE